MRQRQVWRHGVLVLVLSSTGVSSQLREPLPRQEPLTVVQEVFESTVLEIIDGDSVVLKDYDATMARLHLDGVDAPELSQPFGPEARDFLTRLLMRKLVTVRVRVRPTLTREGLARVELHGSDVSSALIRNGMAWYCARFTEDRELDQAAKEARKTRVGLWSGPNPTPPWQHRGATTCWHDGPGRTKE